MAKTGENNSQRRWRETQSYSGKTVSGGGSGGIGGKRRRKRLKTGGNAQSYRRRLSRKGENENSETGEERKPENYGESENTGLSGGGG